MSMPDTVATTLISNDRLASIIKSINIQDTKQAPEMTLTIPAGQHEIFVSAKLDSTSEKILSTLQVFRAGTQYGLVKQFVRQGDETVGPIYSSHIQE